MDQLTKILKKPIAKYIVLALIIIPIIPVVLNIIYFAKYSGFGKMLILNIDLILVFIFLSLLMFGLYMLKNNKTIGILVVTIISLVFISVSSYAVYVNMNVYKSLNNMTTQETVINYSLVSMSKSELTTFKDLENKNIGTLNISKQEVLDNIDGFFEKNKLTGKVNIEKFDTPFELVQKLYNDELDAIIIGDNYTTLFKDQLGFEHIQDETRVLAKIETVIKQEVNNSNSDYGSLVDKPFSILLMGVDSEDEGLSAQSRADSLILATVNPQNLAVTMTSMPRDSYVPIACFNNQKDKITHANNGGSDCVIETVSNWFEVDIPYYVKINFKGLVELIDAIGGIYMYVPQTIVEQNSDRDWGENIVYVEKGYQLLDGEQALALARHRKTLANGDLGRAESQQDVIKAAIGKMLTEFNSVNDVLKIIEILGNNVETNISINQITSSFQYALDTVTKYGANNPMNYIHFKNMVISANFGGIYDLNYEKLLSYAFPFEGAVADAKENMLINLGLKNPEMKYKFNYNPHSIHFGVDWVKSHYNESIPSDIPPVPELVPDFVGEGWTKDQVLSWGKQHGVKINISEIAEGQSGFVASAENNQVVTQSVRAERPVSKINEITIGVVKKALNCALAENQSAEECRNIMPDMISLKYTASKAKEWANSYGIPVTVNLIEWNQSGYDPSKAGRVTAQSVKAFTKVEDIKSLTVDVMDYIIVPDFNKLGWSKDQIDAWAKATSIKISYQDDKFSSTVPQGAWGVNAEIGSILEPNSTINVYKSKGPASFTVSSDYVGKTYNELKSYIDSKNIELGLNISVVKKEVYDANVAAGVIISYTQAGNTISSGEIVVTVSLGAQPSLTVPNNYVGQSYDSFVAFINGENNRLGTKITLSRVDEYHATVPAGVIISYTNGGSVMTSGTITVVVSKGPDQTVTPPPVEPPVEPTPDPTPDPTPPTGEGGGEGNPEPSCGGADQPLCDENGYPIE